MILDNPSLMALTTATTGIYLLRKKEILTIITFCLCVLAGYLFWRLKMSALAGIMNLVQGGSTDIMINSETIMLAIAFTVTVTTACILIIVISVTKRN